MGFRESLFYFLGRDIMILYRLQFKLTAPASYIEAFISLATRIINDHLKTVITNNPCGHKNNLRNEETQHQSRWLEVEEIRALRTTQASSYILQQRSRSVLKSIWFQSQLLIFLEVYKLEIIITPIADLPLVYILVY